MEPRVMRRAIAGSCIVLLALAGTLASRQQQSPPAHAVQIPSFEQQTKPQGRGAPPARAAAPAEPARIEVPAGTHIPLVLHNAISTRRARPGDPVYLETLFPVYVDNRVVIPAGSYVSGEVAESRRAGRVRGRAELMIRLTTLILPNAYIVKFNAVPGSAGTGGGEVVSGEEGRIKGDTDKASDAATVIKMGSLGAGIGGIAARSAKGAGIGAGTGIGIGLLTVLFSRGPEAELPRGTTLDVVLNRPVFFDANKVQFTNPGQASTLPGPPNREPQRNKVPF